MAPRLTQAPPSETITSQHNVAHRKEVVIKSFEEMYEIDSEIKALTKKHLSDLRTRKSEIKKRLRMDFQMPAPLVSARYVGYKMEQAAEDAQDKPTLDAIREMYEYLPVGGGDLFVEKPATVANGGGEAEPARTPAYREGRKAGLMGANVMSNPFTRKKEKEAWSEGWRDGKREAAGETQAEAAASGDGVGGENAAERRAPEPDPAFVASEKGVEVVDLGDAIAGAAEEVAETVH